MEEELIKSEKVFDGRLLKLRVDVVKTKNGLETTREIVEHPGAVAVIALTKEKEIILVQQFRRAAGKILLEIPAGVPRSGERGEEAAFRELEEETGYHAKEIKKIWQGYASPGYSSEIIYYYLAKEMTLLKQKLEEDEQIEVVMVDVEEAMDLVKSGEIIDNKTIIGIMIADLHLRGEL